MNLVRNTRKPAYPAMALNGKQEQKQKIKLYNVIQRNNVEKEKVSCHLSIAQKFLIDLRKSRTFFNLHFLVFSVTAPQRTRDSDPSISYVNG